MLVDVVSSGDLLESLRALRDVLARRLQDSESGSAALARELREVLERIRELESGAIISKGSPIDELAERRGRRAAG